MLRSFEEMAQDVLEDDHSMNSLRAVHVIDLQHRKDGRCNFIEKTLVVDKSNFSERLLVLFTLFLNDGAVFHQHPVRQEPVLSVPINKTSTTLRA